MQGLVRASVAFATLGFACSAAQGQSPAPDPTVIAKVDKLFASYGQNSGPGCSIGVYRNGKNLFSRGYGMASLDQSSANGPGTVFHVASVSKQFTAYAIGLLASEGKLSLDDQASKFIPELPAAARGITIRHLLHHTSGLRDEYELLWMSGFRDEGDVKKLSDVLDLLKRQKALNSPPGAAHLYINTGYTLLGEIVRRVSGQSLRTFAQNRIFTPLGMRHSRFVDDSREVIVALAVPYEAAQGGGFRISQRRFDYVGPMGLYTTVEDLGKWERNLLEGTIGGSDLVGRLAEPSRLTDGTTVPYGLGVYLATHRGEPIMHHDGVDAGYRSTFLRFPTRKLAVATFCNLRSADTANLSRAVADIFLGKSAEAPTAATLIPGAQTEAADRADELARYVGWFVNETNGLIREVKLQDGKLHYSWGSASVELLPQGQDRFSRASTTGETAIPLNDRDEPKQLSVMFEDGQKDTYRYLGRGIFSPAVRDLEKLQGRYFSEELNVHWDAVVKDGKLVLQPPRNGDVVLRAVSLSSFGSASPLGFFVQFSQRNAQVDGFTISNPRVRKLRFNRVGKVQSQ